MKVQDFFSEGLRLVKPEYWTIFFNYIIYVLLMVVASVTIIGLLIVPALYMGFIKFILRAARGEQVDLGDSMSWGFQSGTRWFDSLYFFLLLILGIYIGIFLLVIPGIYLWVVWALGIYLFVDKDLKPIEALSRSRELVHEVGFWKVFLVIFSLSLGATLISLIPILGILAVLFLTPVLFMIYISIYEHAIKGNSESIDANYPLKKNTESIDADFQED